MIIKHYDVHLTPRETEIPDGLCPACGANLEGEGHTVQVWHLTDTMFGGFWSDASKTFRASWTAPTETLRRWTTALMCNTCGEMLIPGDISVANAVDDERRVA